MKLKNYTLFFTFCFLAVLKTVAQPLGWSYSTPVTITNTTGAAVSNYQVKLTVDTQTPIATGHMLATGDDILFGKHCSGDTLLSYWIESGINTTATIIWVKLDTLPATGSVTIFMFYGNGAATPVSNLSTVFFGPNSSTDSVSGGSPGGVTDSQRGFRFSSDQDILVTAFGKNEPTGTTRTLTLFDFASQAILVQMDVAGPAAQYSYSNLPNPIWLTQGTQYLMEMHQGSADGYYFGAAPQMGQGLTYYDMRYCNGCNQNTFPTNSLTGMHYGFPDFWYYTKTNIASAPTVVIGVPDPVNTTAAAQLTICSGNITSLTASGLTGGTLSWYDAPTGGTYLASGTTFITPVLSDTTTYYVQDSGTCYLTNRTALTVIVNPLPAMAISGTSTLCTGDSTTLTATGADTYVWTAGPSTDVYGFVPAATASYTVTGTYTATGCSNTSSQLVTVNVLPVLNIMGTATICAGDSTTITAAGADAYVWTAGPATDAYSVSPAATETYTVTGTNISTGCINTATQTVTVNALPVLNIMGTATVCAGDSTIITAAGADTYVWTGGPATDAYTVSPAATETYTVTGTNATTGCSNTATQMVVVNALPVLGIMGTATICLGDSTTLTATGADAYVWTAGPSTDVYTVSPAVNATYTVTGTNTTTGCSNTMTQTVDVHSVTIAVACSSPASIECEGSVDTLTTSGTSGITYSWNTSATTPDIVVTHATGSPTSFSVIGTDGFGCADTATYSFTSISPLPAVTVDLTGMDTACVASNIVVLSTATPAGGTWSGAGVTGNNFDPAAAGVGAHVIAYTYANTNGCENSASSTIYVLGCVGINELAGNVTLNVYPNPSTGEFSIESNTDGVYTIVNELGQTVRSFKMDGASGYTLKVAGLTNGIYFITGTTNDKVIVRKKVVVTN